MHLPPTRNLKVVRYAEGFGFSAVEWEEALAAIDWRRDAEPLKAGRKGSVWRATVRLGGRAHDCVLKVEPLGGVWKRAKALLRMTKAWRQWKGAELLRRAEVGSATPLVVLRTSDAELLALRHAAGPTLLEVLNEGSIEYRSAVAIAEQLAVTMSRMWRHHLVNRDPKPSNIVRCASGGLVFIDTVAIRQDRQTRTDHLPSEEDVVEMLSKLVIEPTGCGCPPPRTLCLRVLHAMHRHGLVFGSGSPRQHARALWESVLEDIAFHGDPTPADDPLARPDVPR